MINRQYTRPLFSTPSSQPPPPPLAFVSLSFALLRILLCAVLLQGSWAMAANSERVKSYEEKIAALEAEIKSLPKYIKSQRKVQSLAKSKLRSVDEALARTRSTYHETVHLGDDEAKIENARFKLYLAEKQVSRADEVLRDTQRELERREQLLVDKRAELEEYQSKLVTAKSRLRTEQEQEKNLTLQRAARTKLEQEKAAQRKLVQEKAARRNAQAQQAAAEKKRKEDAARQALADEKRNRDAKEAAKAKASRNTNGVYAIIQDDVELNNVGRNATSSLKIYPKNNAGTPTTITMKFIGQSQFRAESEISAGPNQFVIGAKRWSFSVPEKDDGATYVFIFDSRRNGGKRLVLYNKDFGRP